MSLKVKLIIAAIIILISVTSVISIFVYISHLNNKITDLSVTIAEQNNQIEALNCQIDSLEKNVESLHETINITNDYISSVEKAREDEMNTKEEVLQTVINDPEAEDWYSEPIPQSLIDVLLRESDSMVCND